MVCSLQGEVDPLGVVTGGSLTIGRNGSPSSSDDLDDVMSGVCSACGLEHWATVEDGFAAVDDESDSASDVLHRSVRARRRWHFLPRKRAAKRLWELCLFNKRLDHWTAVEVWFVAADEDDDSQCGILD